MWLPDPTWVTLPGGRGTLTAGLWRTPGEPAYVVKRVAAPGPDDPPELADPAHPGYWRREAEAALALSDPGRAPTGLVPPTVIRVEEDEGGYALWTTAVPATDVPALFAARAVGRFAGSRLSSAPWLARGLLGARLARTARRGGWASLAQTAVADLAGHVWDRRAEVLARYDALPQHPAHGDVVPANLLAIRGADVVTIDWGSLGTAPVGADLGYFALSCREDFDVLLDAYREGVAESRVVADPDDVAFAARAMLGYTVLSRAEWALSRAASGEGPLTAKLRHPALAVHLRTLQRHLPQFEALLTG